MYKQVMYAKYVNQTLKYNGKLAMTQTILHQNFEYYLVENTNGNFAIEVICRTSLHTCDLIGGYFLPNDNYLNLIKEDLKKYLIWVLTN